MTNVRWNNAKELDLLTRPRMWGPQLGLLLGGVAPARAGTLDSLAWMAGSCAHDENGVREEEHSMTPRGALMVGMSRRASAERARGFEFFSIEERADGVFSLSSPGGAPATPFKLKELSRQRVVFETPSTISRSGSSIGSRSPECSARGSRAR